MQAHKKLKDSNQIKVVEKKREFETIYYDPNNPESYNTLLLKGEFKRFIPDKYQTKVRILEHRSHNGTKKPNGYGFRLVVAEGAYIKPGEIICNYLGDYNTLDKEISKKNSIEPDEGKRRQHQKMVLKYALFYTAQSKKKEGIFAHDARSAGGFANAHMTKPNAEFVIKKKGKQKEAVLQATETISPFDEITLDYGEDYHHDEKTRYINTISIDNWPSPSAFIAENGFYYSHNPVKLTKKQKEVLRTQCDYVLIPQFLETLLNDQDPTIPPDLLERLIQLPLIELNSYKIDDGINIDIEENQLNITSLIFACATQRIKVIKKLLKLNADPFIRTMENDNVFSILLNVSTNEDKFINLIKPIIADIEDKPIDPFLLITHEGSFEQGIISVLKKKQWLSAQKAVLSFIKLELNSRPTENESSVLRRSKRKKSQNDKKIEVVKKGRTPPSEIKKSVSKISQDHGPSIAVAEPTHKRQKITDASPSLSISPILTEEKSNRSRLNILAEITEKEKLSRDVAFLASFYPPTEMQSPTGISQLPTSEEAAISLYGASDSADSVIIAPSSDIISGAAALAAIASDISSDADKNIFDPSQMTAILASLTQAPPMSQPQQKTVSQNAVNDDSSIKHKLSFNLKGRAAFFALYNNELKFTITNVGYALLPGRKKLLGFSRETNDFKLLYNKISKICQFSRKPSYEEICDKIFNMKLDNSNFNRMGLCNIQRARNILPWFAIPGKTIHLQHNEKLIKNYIRCHEINPLSNNTIKDFITPEPASITENPQLPESHHQAAAPLSASHTAPGKNQSLIDAKNLEGVEALFYLYDNELISQILEVSHSLVPSKKKLVGYSHVTDDFKKIYNKLSKICNFSYSPTYQQICDKIYNKKLDNEDFDRMGLTNIARVRNILPWFAIPGKTIHLQHNETLIKEYIRCHEIKDRRNNKPKDFDPSVITEIPPLPESHHQAAVSLRAASHTAPDKSQSLIEAKNLKGVDALFYLYDKELKSAILKTGGSLFPAKKPLSGFGSATKTFEMLYHQLAKVCNFSPLPTYQEISDKICNVELKKQHFDLMSLSNTQRARNILSWFIIPGRSVHHQHNEKLIKEYIEGHEIKAVRNEKSGDFNSRLIEKNMRETKPELPSQTPSDKGIAQNSPSPLQVFSFFQPSRPPSLSSISPDISPGVSAIPTKSVSQVDEA